jgi:hypothetical protein
MTPAARIAKVQGLIEQMNQITESLGGKVKRSARAKQIVCLLRAESKRMQANIEDDQEFLRGLDTLELLLTEFNQFGVN